MGQTPAGAALWHDYQQRCAVLGGVVAVAAGGWLFDVCDHQVLIAGLGCEDGFAVFVRPTLVRWVETFGKRFAAWANRRSCTSSLGLMLN